MFHLAFTLDISDAAVLAHHSKPLTSSSTSSRRYPPHHPRQPMISFNSPALSRRARTILAILFFIPALVFLHNFNQTVDSQTYQPTTIETGSRKLTSNLNRHKQKWHCRNWDPSMPEAEDNPHCLKAKQYRQVTRVLEREVLYEHQTRWYFTQQWNIDVFKKAQKCFLPDEHPDSISCPEKPIIVTGYWWSATNAVNGTTGENIWQMSLFAELEKKGYLLALMGPYENWQTAFEMMPDTIPFLWVGEVDAISCVGDPRCVIPEHYRPAGKDLSVGVPEDELGRIPLNKMLVVDYWGSRPISIFPNDYYYDIREDEEWTYHPFGARWTATPWPVPGHTYLPYSLEDNCPAVKPWEERQQAALLLAKTSGYFDLGWTSDPEMWSLLSMEEDFDLITTATVEDGHPLPYGLKSIGGRNRQEYEELLGGVKALVGVGMPKISPSVYQALCQGVPVVIPQYDDQPDIDSWEMYGTWSQHGPAALIGPPYVYSYDVDDYDSLNDTIHAALSTPIDSYIPEEMLRPSVVSHLEEYLATDWDAIYRQVLKENGGHVPRQHPRILERCHKLGRCFKFAPGSKRYVYNPPQPVEMNVTVSDIDPQL